MLKPWPSKPEHPYLHVLELDADQQEVDAPDYDILQVIPCPVILKLNVKAVLDADLHLHT
jgi:hypothetical protein